MPTKLKVLIVEDSAADAELALHELRRSGYDPEWKRVETEPDYLAQLDQGWEIILADYNLPEFSGMRALELLRERDPELPFIIVSGTIGEDKAVAAMKAGANDYIMKDRLARLGPAVERELRDAVQRRGRKRAEEELRESEERFKLIFEYAPDAYYLNDLKGNFIDGNKAAEKTTGYKREELIGGSFLKLKLLSMDQLPKAAKLLIKNATGRSTGPDEFVLKRKSGEKVHVEISTHPLKIENKTVVLGIARDITERLLTEEARRQAEENFRRSLDESPLGIRIVSAEGETLYANHAILEIYGYADIEELRSTPIKKRYTPESYAEYQERKKKRMGGEDDHSEYEISIVRKTGEIRHLLVFRKEILWDDQKQFQTIYRDITERKKTAEKLKETLGGLRKALGGIIQVLSAAVEQRDPYTAGHQKRVADLAQAIAQEMGLASDRVEGIRMAGVIHDVGKLSIPAEILSKPTCLADIEYKLIQSHSQAGRDILRGIDFAWPIAEMVLQHHERMDGSGYPQRLKGDDILLEARILAVADVVEAMASHRPYRPALGIEAALKEIEKNKGILFDADVVSACLTLFREKGFRFGENPAD